MMKIFRLPILILMGIALIPWFSTATAAGQSYRFGVFPYLSPLRLDQIYSPVARELSKALDRQINFRTSTSTPRFKERLQTGYYEIALMPPIYYPYAIDTLGYLPVARMEESFYSLIVTLESNDIRSVDDLKGKKIGLPPIMGPVVVLAQRSLVKQGISLESDVSFEKHRTLGGCFQKLLARKLDACVSPSFAVSAFKKFMGVEFRTVMKSESFANQLFMVHPRVSEQDRDRIRDTIFSWRNSEQGKRLLEAMNTTGFVKVEDGDYDSMRSFLLEVMK